MWTTLVWMQEIVKPADIHSHIEVYDENIMIDGKWIHSLTKWAKMCMMMSFICH